MYFLIFLLHYSNRHFIINNKINSCSHVQFTNMYAKNINRLFYKLPSGSLGSCPTLTVYKSAQVLTKFCLNNYLYLQNLSYLEKLELHILQRYYCRCYLSSVLTRTDTGFTDVIIYVIQIISKYFFALQH